MLKRDQIKFTKDIKVSLILHIQVYITLHKPLVCDTKTRKVKDTKKTFVPRRKKWKLHEKKKHINFNSYAKEFEENSDANFSTEGY